MSPRCKGLAEAENWLRSQNLLEAAEFKSGSIAVHWRGLADSEAQTMRDRVIRGLGGHCQALRAGRDGFRRRVSRFAAQRSIKEQPCAPF